MNRFEMKTASQIKDEYAVSQGYLSCADLRNCFCMDGFMMSVREDIVMMLYANQKLDEAAESFTNSEGKFIILSLKDKI